ncbi:MAG TPA: HEAT repeat domain-containing protein [Pirellulaceae bacterium]|nr:HEAT repeat domain-containing protein [Pirellulaceae bacterium]
MIKRQTQFEWIQRWAVAMLFCIPGAMRAEEGVKEPDRTAPTSDKAVAEIMSRWKKEISPQQRKFLVSELEAIGTRRAFFEMVRIACEDASPDVRAQAARWIAKQDNREEAIPQFVKYLKNKKFFRNALTSLGYTEIARKASRQDPELVAALIDNLVTVTPVIKRVRGFYDSGNVYGPDWGRVRRSWGDRDLFVTEYVKTHCPEAKQLLYQYTAQDLGYDQNFWRKSVLTPLRKQRKEEQ